VLSPPSFYLPFQKLTREFTLVLTLPVSVEVPLEEVVIWQKEMVERCIAAAPGKPVIVATQVRQHPQANDGAFIILILKF